ncbi:MAG: 16S rRNA (guanine(966)-N(2))-methyltransferase RsmD [Burkholderiales bacterium]|nr:16S rRNA (guanine(966)-N(2))-methyltransferase RsmD [Burkholderiales bacterium]
MKAKSSSSAPPGKRPVRPRGVQTHEIRIIGGQWKRTKLKVADKPGLRPTPDRVRETLFNWLGQDLSGRRCLDAFAGTGALGFEAASRGAAEVVLVEQDAALVVQLQQVRIQLLALKPLEPVSAPHLLVQRGEGVAAIRQAAPGSRDLIFLDPPFDAPLFEPALAACARALSPEGLVYLEAPVHWTDEQLAPMGLAVQRHLKAGAVHAHLLRLAAA